MERTVGVMLSRGPSFTCLDVANNFGMLGNKTLRVTEPSSFALG